MALQVNVGGQFSATGMQDLYPFGWRDDFDRPDSTSLGVTARGKRAWGTLLSVPEADAKARIVGGQLAASGATGYSLAYADAGTPDVRLEAKVAARDAAATLATNLRLAVRIGAATATAPQFASLRLNVAGGVQYATFDSYVPGQPRVIVQSSPLGDVLGKRLALQAKGDVFTAYLDGVAIMPPQTVPGLGGLTRHGVQANNSANAVRFDDMAAIPV
jgi:hypothetical protein